MELGRHMLSNLGLRIAFAFSALHIAVLNDADHDIVVGRNRQDHFLKLKVEGQLGVWFTRVSDTLTWS
jgi:hypothetical protein